jgi:hypothetical protein
MEVITREWSWDEQHCGTCGRRLRVVEIVEDTSA